jgi:hypothetical protein
MLNQHFAQIKILKIRHLIDAMTVRNLRILMELAGICLIDFHVGIKDLLH